VNETEQAVVKDKKWDQKNFEAWFANSAARAVDAYLSAKSPSVLPPLSNLKA
jgi:hypothetical protein